MEKRESNAARERREVEEAKEQLRAMLPPGSTVYCVLRRVSRSGMYRHISLHTIDCGQLRWITWLAAKAMGATFKSETDAIGVGGCGMDMGYHLVHNLGLALYPDGFQCIGKGCPSPDHRNQSKSDTEVLLEQNVCADHVDIYNDAPCSNLFCVPRQHGKYQGGYALEMRWI